MRTYEKKYSFGKVFCFYKAKGEIEDIIIRVDFVICTLTL